MRKHVQRILDHVWGPVGSVILHILILLALFKFVRFVQRAHQPEVEVVIMEPDAMDLEDLLDPEELEEMPEIVETVTPPDVSLTDEPPDVEDFQDEVEDDMPRVFHP